MSISVVILGSDDEVVHRIESYRGELIVVRVCEDMSEAVASCGSGLADALIVTEPALLPPMEQIDFVLDQQVVLVVLDDPAPTPTRPPGVLAAARDGSTAELEALITKGVKALGLRSSRSSGGLDPSEEAREKTTPGVVTTVWGAIGSPGRSTVALNLAVEAAVAGQRVVLIDADTYGASIAIQLGLLDESASVAQLCRVVDTGTYDVSLLEAVCLSVQVGPATLLVASGIPRSSRWPEIRPSSLRRAVSVFKEHYDRVILDVAAPVETDEQLSFDTFAPQRNGVTVQALHFSDEVLMVVAADSVGIPRAIRAMDELADQSLEPPVSIVFNKISSAGTGRSPKSRVAEAWERFGPSAPIAGFLPSDNTACQAAVLAGSALLEIIPRCALRSEIRALAQRNLPFRAGLKIRPARQAEM